MTTVTTTDAKPSSPFKLHHIPWRALTMVGALLVIWIIFSVSTAYNSPTHTITFLTARNLSLLARQMAVTSILAVGMVLVIVAGEIDLSVGAMAGFLGAISAMAFVNAHWPLWLAFAAALALGTALGLMQGTLVAWLKIPSFIVTLGGMLIFQGALLGFTGGVSTSPSPSFLYVGQEFVAPALGWGIAGVLSLGFGYRIFRATTTKDRLRWGGLIVIALAFTALMNSYEGVPIPVMLVLVLTAGFSLLAHHTPFGRHLYAIGGNKEAAFYSGIDIKKHTLRVFGLMGFMAGIAGVVLTARVGSATSDAGRMMELDAIAAAVIGGTSLRGGQGTVWGALLGALIMASLDNGMSLMNTESFWQPVIKGLILVAAVGADMSGKKDRA